MDEWSDDEAVVEAIELRLEDGIRFLGGGGGGGPFAFARTAYGTDTAGAALEGDVEEVLG